MTLHAASTLLPARCVKVDPLSDLQRLTASDSGFRGMKWSKS